MFTLCHNEQFVMEPTESERASLGLETRLRLVRFRTRERKITSTKMGRAVRFFNVTGGLSSWLFDPNRSDKEPWVLVGTEPPPKPVKEHIPKHESVEEDLEKKKTCDISPLTWGNVCEEICKIELESKEGIEIEEVGLMLHPSVSWWLVRAMVGWVIMF